MNKALDDAQGTAGQAKDWRKSISDHVAYALLVYTGIHIFATVGAMKDTGLKTGALVALCILVAAIIPALRKFENRWKRLTDEQAVDPGYGAAFKRDVAVLWALAIGLPFALTFALKAIAAAM